MCVVLSDAEDKEALQKLVVDKPRRTAVGLNRLLTSPAIEVKSSYSFPDEEKALRRELKDEKVTSFNFDVLLCSLSFSANN
jgi:hypothetical protein